MTTSANHYDLADLSTVSNYTLASNTCICSRGEGADGSGPTPLGYSMVALLLACCGILTNLGFIFTMMRVPFLRTKIYNYYLLSLSLVDTFYLLSLIAQESMILYYQFPEVRNHINLYATQFSTYFPSQASILTITLIAAERYLAICHPFTSKLTRSKSRTIGLLAGVWLTAGLLTIPFMLLAEDRFYYNSSYLMACHILDICILIVPVIFTCTFYGRTTWELTRNKEMKRQFQPQVLKNHVRLTRMLVVATVIFFTCTFPYFVYVLLFDIVKLGIGEDQDNLFNNLVTFLLVFNSAINPIIYVIFSKEHRRAMKMAFLCRREEIKHFDRSSRSSSIKSVNNRTKSNSIEITYDRKYSVLLPIKFLKSGSQMT